MAAPTPLLTGPMGVPPISDDDTEVTLEPGVVLDLEAPVVLKNVGIPVERSGPDPLNPFQSPASSPTQRHGRKRAAPDSGHELVTPVFRPVEGYDRLTPAGFHRPPKSFYRHRSASVTDTGLQYDLESDDERFVAKLNASHGRKVSHVCLLCADAGTGVVADVCFSSSCAQVLRNSALEEHIALLEKENHVVYRRESERDASRKLGARRKKSLARVQSLLRRHQDMLEATPEFLKAQATRRSSRTVRRVWGSHFVSVNGGL